MQGASSGRRRAGDRRGGDYASLWAALNVCRPRQQRLPEPHRTGRSRSCVSVQASRSALSASAPHRSWTSPGSSSCRSTATPTRSRTGTAGRGRPRHPRGHPRGRTGRGPPPPRYRRATRAPQGVSGTVMVRGLRIRNPSADLPGSARPALVWAAAAARMRGGARCCKSRGRCERTPAARRPSRAAGEARGTGCGAVVVLAGGSGVGTSPAAARPAPRRSPQPGPRPRSGCGWPSTPRSARAARA